LTFKTIAGSGAVTYNSTASPPLPRPIGGLDAGDTMTVRFYLNVTAGVTRFSFSPKITLRDPSGATHTIAITLPVTP
jgi:hypothetical protein